MTSIPEARSSFNLKVLRRHDPSIVEIVEIASFVVLYNYNSGEWTKTGVEGPLFLFRRRLPPYNGFFLMNRNGVENFSADVTPDDDLEITPEFIIYRPEKNGDNEVYGIWVFEPNQRMAVGDKLLKLQQMADAPSDAQLQEADRASSSTVPVGSGEAKQVKGVEAGQQKGAKEAEVKGAKGKANGKPKRGAKQAAAATAAATAAVEAEKSHDDELGVASAPADNVGGTQINLDDLFGSAPAPAHSEAEPTETAAVPAQDRSLAEPAASNGTTLLDSLFQKSVSLDTSAAAEAPKSTAVSGESTDSNHAQNLLALLGGNTVSSNPTPPAVAADTAPAPAKPATESAPSTEHKAGAPKMSDLIEQGIRDRIGLGDDGKPLSRREFVTELLSMVHTNPEFVTELHESYLSRVS
ncbi:related to decapping enzyme [Sporisorium reilianum f. sp. reilianum]|uniref:Related to decapping enzyme n=1 Tax=Sporisorium reilianum f. sp. reilianum TaxID=72559 RepID=A0A2N8UEL9_9BASI|nr:related to decapping enzyme [Sporisorium reilianum f. sp. reilianum]